MGKDFKEASKGTLEMDNKLKELQAKQSNNESEVVTKELLGQGERAEDNVTAGEILNGEKIETDKSFLEQLEADTKEDEEEYLPIETIKLRMPVKEINEVVLDTTKVTGGVLSRIQAVYAKKTKKGRTEFIKELDPIYLTLVAVVMSELSYNTFMEMNGADYTKICNKVRDFLLAS